MTHPLEPWSRDDERTLVAPRYRWFAAICGAWLAAMSTWPDASLLQSAGRTWFANWSIQAAVAIAFWMRPFSLPGRYYRLRFAGPAWRARVPGVARYARVAHWLNPLPFNRRSPRTLEAALGAAETTHAITFAAVSSLTLIAVARGAHVTAAFLGLWNVLFNLYPVAVQRHNRARLHRLVHRRGDACPDPLNRRPPAVSPN